MELNRYRWNAVSDGFEKEARRHMHLIAFIFHLAFFCVPSVLHAPLTLFLSLAHACLGRFASIRHFGKS